MGRYRKFLIPAALLVLTLFGCGHRTPAPSLAGLEGWWEVTDDWEARSGFCPVFGSFYLDAGSATAQGYDSRGNSLGEFLCTLEGSCLTMQCDALMEIVEADPSGTALFSGDTRFYRRTDARPRAPVCDCGDLSGKWYLGSSPAQWLEFREDGSCLIRKEAGEILMEDDYEIDYLLPGREDILSIELRNSFRSLIPVTGLRAFYLDQNSDGWDCLIHESLMDTPEARQVMNGTRVCNLRYHSPQETLEYPTYWVIRFLPGSMVLEKVEDRGWDGQYIHQEAWEPWSVTADGILTMEFRGSPLRFSLEQIRHSLSPDPQWPVFYRVP